MIYRLPAKPALAAAIATGKASMAVRRLNDLVLRAGYVVGDGGIALNRDGSVTIDLDRDPTADWAGFDPDALTTDESATAAALTRAQGFLDKLDAGTSLTTAETRQLQAWLIRNALRGAGG